MISLETPLQERKNLVAGIDSTADMLEAFRDYFATTKQVLTRLATAAESHPFTVAEQLAAVAEHHAHMYDVFDEFAYGLIITCRRSAADLRRRSAEATTEAEHHGPPTADE